MDQVVHGYGTTTEMAHRAMQHSQEGLRALATRHDIMTVAKGLGGGFLPLGATVYHQRVAEPIDRVYGGVLTGHTFTGHTAACAAGVAVQAGHRWGDWMAFGEYDGLGLGGDDLRDGTLHRVGAAVRYDAIDFGKQLSAKIWAGGVVWLEGGLGLEHARWPGATRVDRQDVAFGVGAEYRIKRLAPAAKRAWAAARRLPEIPA